MVSDGWPAVLGEVRRDKQGVFTAGEEADVAGKDGFSPTEGCEGFVPVPGFSARGRSLLVGRAFVFFAFSKAHSL